MLVVVGRPHAYYTRRAIYRMIRLVCKRKKHAEDKHTYSKNMLGANFMVVDDARRWFALSLCLLLWQTFERATTATTSGKTPNLTIPSIPATSACRPPPPTSPPRRRWSDRPSTAVAAVEGSATGWCRLMCMWCFFFLARAKTYTRYLHTCCNVACIM